MQSIKNLILICLCFSISLFPVQKAQALDLGKALLGGAIEFALVKSIYVNEDTNKQDQWANQYVKEYGMSSNQEYTEQLRIIMNRIENAPNNEEARSRPIKAFVNSHKDMNAFRGVGNVISMNEGLWTGLNYNEDEVAFIYSHEVAHGSKKHLIRGLDKILGLPIIAQLYLASNKNNLSYIMTPVSLRYLLAKSNTLPFEWEADNTGFIYATNAGYNPGAGAAAKVRMKAKYGDYAPNFFGELLNPNDHPTFTQRIHNFSQKLTEYSKNNVSVTGSTIKVKEQDFFTPNANYGQLKEERAYLIAGNLARYFHDNITISEAYVEDGAVKINGFTIVTPADNETSPEATAARLNQIQSLIELPPLTEAEIEESARSLRDLWFLKKADKAITATLQNQ